MGRTAGVSLVIAIIWIFGWVAGLIGLSGCGGTFRVELQQVPATSRLQWEVDVTDRINKLDLRLKQLEQQRREEETNA